MGMSDTIASWFGFARVASTSVDSTSKTVEVKAQSSDDEDTSVSDELFGSAAVLYRPVAPNSAGECEALVMRAADERIVFATRDKRWQIEVAEGEVIVRAMGSASPAYVKLTPGGAAEVHATTINLGGSATQFVALSNLVSTELTALKTAISGAAVLAGDGGAVFKANIIAALATWPASTAAAKTKAE